MFMDKGYFYCYVADHKSVYKVQPGCCYRQVIFEGEKLAIVDRNDRPFSHFNSEHLECGICDPNLKIDRITRAEFEAKEKRVLNFLERFTSNYLKNNRQMEI